MALSVTHLCNLALSAIGHTRLITDIEEASNEAEQCNLWYEPVRKMVFSAAPWASLESYARLSLLAERDDDAAWVATDPAPGWTYAYARPADMIWPRYQSDFGNFFPGTRNSQRAIMSNSESPILYYTRDEENVDFWEPMLYMAMSYTLAAHICKGVTGRDSDLGNMMQLGEDLVLRARAQNANYRADRPLDYLPPELAARGYSGGTPTALYVYPPGGYSFMGTGNLG